MSNKNNNLSLFSNGLEEIDFTVTRTGSKSVASSFEEVNQTITLYNNTDQEVSNISIVDTIKTGATFKPNSVQIGGISYPDLDPTEGFSLNSSISVGNSETITYTVIMDQFNPTITTSVDLVSLVNLVYGIDEYIVNSNTYTIEFPHGEIEIENTSDKSAVIQGQTLMFQSVVKNTGTLTDTNLIFKNPIPQGTTYVDGSVTIDGAPYLDYEPHVGFPLDPIDGKSERVITFNVTVD